MKYIYTATFIPNEDGTKFYCRVPDLPGCVTTGNSMENAIEMITDTKAVRKNVSLPAWMAALAEKRGGLTAPRFSRMGL